VAATPEIALSSPPPQAEPPVAGTSAERLARALGTEVGTDEAGNATVELPAPGAPPFVPFSTAPRSVSRAEPATTETPPAEAPATEMKAESPDLDEIAETVINRLRRELLIEREQSGGSMDLF
ncbi:MAG: hypothetical protein ACRDPC_17605, partial [Solirubrobacteraceae bacterium]